MTTTEPFVALVSSAAAVGSEPRSSAPLPLSAIKFPETAVSSSVVNASSTASGVATIVIVAVAVLSAPFVSVIV